MEPNVGGRDRIARGVLSVALAAAGLAAVAGLVPGGIGAGVGALALAASGALAVNVLTRRCLGNHLLGIDTCRVDPGE